jgi:PleD family two-component response regulator
VLLTRADGDEARRVAERIVARARAATCESPAPIAVSVGVATASPGDDPALLVRRADDALYEAKEAGKGRAASAGLSDAA